MSDVTEFGLEDAKIIKTQGVDKFKLNRSGEVARISIISFKTYQDVIWAQKAKAKGEALTEAEKKELLDKINAKLAEQAKKSVEELTEVDRLDPRSPRFSLAYTHYKDGLGSIRCLSKREGSTVVKAEYCCQQIGDADQTIATVVLKYPTDKEGNIDLDLFKMRKMTEVLTLKMSAKKFKKVENVLIDARNHEMPVIDLKVTLDGDSKYQKFVIENGYHAQWAKNDTDPEIRRWVLEQGIRAWKYVKGELGFEMTKDKLIERLRGDAASAAALSGGEASAAKPQQNVSYDNLLD